MASEPDVLGEDPSIQGPDFQGRARTPAVVQRALRQLAKSRFFQGLGPERALIFGLKQVRQFLHDLQIKSRVLVFDLQSLRQISEWGSESTLGSTYTTSLAVIEDRNNVLTFAGADNGELFLHDSSSSQQIDRMIRAHRDKAAALCISASQTGTCVISGGSAGFVRFWTLRLEPLGEIEVETPICSLSMAGNDMLFVGTTRGVMMLRLDWELILSSADRTGLSVAT